jgi:hypothetical protein
MRSLAAAFVSKSPQCNIAPDEFLEQSIKKKIIFKNRPAKPELK